MRSFITVLLVNLKKKLIYVLGLFVRGTCSAFNVNYTAGVSTNSQFKAQDL